MSVLICGMEIPKNEPLLVKINPDGSVSTTAKNDYKKYEAIPVPPHGRLIDESEVMQRLGITDMDCTKCAWGKHGFCGRGGDFNDACEAIEEATTIIEAEDQK